MKAFVKSWAAISECEREVTITRDENGFLAMNDYPVVRDRKQCMMLIAALHAAAAEMWPVETVDDALRRVRKSPRPETTP